MKTPCADCGAPSQRRAKWCVSCSYIHRSLEENARWKGGRHVGRKGYIMIRVAPGVYRFEHRLVMEAHLGRELLPEETVHHKNGKRDDNRIENLELWASSHPSGQRVEDLVSWAKDILDKYENLELPGA